MRPETLSLHHACDSDYQSAVAAPIIDIEQADLERALQKA